MFILTIRTDKPEAEIGLYSGREQLDYKVWQAHRELSKQLHTVIHDMLQAHGKDWPDIQGIVAFQGPGSFTGLRIGLTVANALAYGLSIPVVAAQNDWIEHGIDRLLAGDHDKLALPEYGRPAHITQQKK